MKKSLFVLVALLVLGLGVNALAGVTPNSENDRHSECKVESYAVTEIATVFNENPGEARYDEYEVALSCPNCRQVMTAVFKLGYGSTTKAACSHCHKKYLIEYSWPRDHKSPTIKSISETN